MKTVYLASKSKRRLEILKNLGLKVKTVSSSANEDGCFDSFSPAEIVEGLASRKIRHINENEVGDGIVIAADTVVALDGAILGKPADENDAFRMLTMLSESRHEVYTGFAVRKNNKLICDHVMSKVHFRKLTPEEIEAYIATGEPMDKAGAYGIQEKGGLFVSHIEGDYFNIMGLPVCRLSEILKKEFDFDILV